MEILFLSDTHGFKKIPNIKPDLIILLGDIEYYELRIIDEKYECPKIGVLGNHDSPDYFNDTNIINAHKEIIDVKGLKIAGFEGSPKYNKRKYLQYTENEVEEFTLNLEKVDIFISHSNPMLLPIYDPTDPHRGFKAFTDYIYDKQPNYFIHGHLHESKKETIGETELIGVYPSTVLHI